MMNKIEVSDMNATKTDAETIPEILDDVNEDERNGVAAWRYDTYLSRIMKAYVRDKENLKAFHRRLVGKLQKIWDKANDLGSLSESIKKPIEEVVDDIVGCDLHEVPLGKAQRIVKEWKQYVWRERYCCNGKIDENDMVKFTQWLINNGKVTKND